jgi:hypothetical protein
MSVYEPSPTRKARATQAEMEARATFLLAYAEKHAPVTVRQLYYVAEVHGVPGITKSDGDYDKVQRQVLKLRRDKRMPYSAIADATRWMRKPSAYDGVADALQVTAAFYRRNIWNEHPEHVEIWVEKDALAGVIYPVTSEYGVPLMVSRGFSSETFAFEAAQSYAADGRPVHVYHLGDFDRSGVAAAEDLCRKLTSFAAEADVAVHFTRLGVTPEQIASWGLPTREPKRESAADRRWPHDFACELDAIDPDRLRLLVRSAIRRHMPDDLLRIAQVAEESEREQLRIFARRAA